MSSQPKDTLPKSNFTDTLVQEYLIKLIQSEFDLHYLPSTSASALTPVMFGNAELFKKYAAFKKEPKKMPYSVLEKFRTELIEAYKKSVRGTLSYAEQTAIFEEFTKRTRQYNSFKLDPQPSKPEVTDRPSSSSSATSVAGTSQPRSSSVSVTGGTGMAQSSSSLTSSSMAGSSFNSPFALGSFSGAFSELSEQDSPEQDRPPRRLPGADGEILIPSGTFSASARAGSARATTTSVFATPFMREPSLAEEQAAMFRNIALANASASATRSTAMPASSSRPLVSTSGSLVSTPPRPRSKDDGEEWEIEQNPYHSDYYQSFYPQPSGSSINTSERKRQMEDVRVAASMAATASSTATTSSSSAKPAISSSSHTLSARSGVAQSQLQQQSKPKMMSREEALQYEIDMIDKLPEEEEENDDSEAQVVTRPSTRPATRPAPLSVARPVIQPGVARPATQPVFNRRDQSAEHPAVIAFLADENERQEALTREMLAREEAAARASVSGIARADDRARGEELTLRMLAREAAAAAEAAQRASATASASATARAPALARTSTTTSPPPLTPARTTATARAPALAQMATRPVAPAGAALPPARAGRGAQEAVDRNAAEALEIREITEAFQQLEASENIALVMQNEEFSAGPRAQPTSRG